MQSASVSRRAAGTSCRCPERDNIILALVLAANEGTVASEDVELAASDGERRSA